MSKFNRLVELLTLLVLAATAGVVGNYLANNLDFNSLEPVVILLAITIAAGLSAFLSGMKDAVELVDRLIGKARNRRVFISYPAVARNSARELSKSLKDSGFQVWIADDEILPGQSLTEALTSALKKADVFVMLITREGSKRMEKELAMALELQKYVIPIMLENAQLPEPLKNTAYLDYGSDADKGYAKKKLVEALHRAA